MNAKELAEKFVKQKTDEQWAQMQADDPMCSEEGEAIQEDLEQFCEDMDGLPEGDELKDLITEAEKFVKLIPAHYEMVKEG